MMTKSEAVLANRRGFLTGAAATGAYLIGGRSARAQAGTSLSVPTRSGLVRGSVSEGILTFLGIPYGADTGGPRRFMPPTREEAWSGVREATRYGPSCPQIDFENSGYPDTPAAPAYVRKGEDCLVLNVWTPGADRARRPVMVWLHGGGYQFGSGSDPTTVGEELARRGDVVLLTLNHRVGVLGFTHLGQFGGRFAQSDNLGLQDLVAALHWVRENIAEFGGDPENVTIFGCSGGGQKVAALLAMPSATGLFHRGILQSGPMLQGITQGHANTVVTMLLKELDLSQDHLEALADVPTDRLVKAATAVEQRFPSYEGAFGNGFFPVVDGRILPVDPFSPGAAVSGANVPLMIGMAGTEFVYWVGPDEAQYNLDEAGLRRYLVNRLHSAEDADWAIGRFRQLLPRATPSDLWFAIQNAYAMYPLISDIADRKSAQPAPVYGYVFDWRSPVAGGKYRSPHGIDEPFVFGTATTTRVNLTGGGPAVKRMQDRVIDIWSSFARYGRPQAKGLPEWPRYSSQDRRFMMIDNVCHVGPYLPEDIRLRMRALLYRSNITL